SVLGNGPGEEAFDYPKAVALAQGSPSSLHLWVEDYYHLGGIYGPPDGIPVIFGSSATGEVCPAITVTVPGEAAVDIACSQPIRFYGGEPDPSRSFASVTQLPNQWANHDDPEVSPENWGSQTVFATLRDVNGNPSSQALPQIQAALGDPYEGAGLCFSNDGSFSCSVPEDEADGSCPNGVYTVVVHSAYAGQRQLEVTHDSYQPVKLPNADHPGQTTLWAPFAEALSPAASTLTVSPSVPEDLPDDAADEPDGVPLALASGEAYTLTVTAWDAPRVNRVGNVSAELTLTGANCHATFESSGQAAALGVTSALGRFADKVGSAVGGECELTARLAGETIAGSPKTLSWTDPEPDPSHPDTWFTVSPEPVTADGDASGVITVQLVAAGGQPVTGAAQRLAPSQAPGASPVRDDLVFSAFTHQGDGVYTATFSGTVAAATDLAVGIVGQSVEPLALRPTDGNATARFKAGPVSLGTSWLIEPAGPVPADGQTPALVGASLADAAGNAVTSGNVVFTVPAGTRVGAVDGPAAIPVAVGDDGTAWLQLTSENPCGLDDPYLVGAFPEGGAIPIPNVKDAWGTPTWSDGQVRVVFTVGPPDLTRSGFSVEPAAGNTGRPTPLADGNDAQIVTVELRDAHGVPVDGQAARVAMTFGSGGGVPPVVVDVTTGTAGRGRAEARLTTNQAGPWAITVETAGGNLGWTGDRDLKSINVSFAAGPPSAADSVLTSSAGTEVPAGGAEAHWAQVEVFDQNGNLAPDAVVTFELLGAGGSPARFSSPLCPTKVCDVVSSATGIAKVELVSTSFEVVTLRASVGGQLVGEAVLEFGTSPPPPVLSSWTVTPAYPQGVVADGVASFTALVELRDSSGIPAPDATVVFDLPTEVSVVEDGPYLTDADGLLEVHLVSTTAGAFVVNASAGGRVLPEADQVLRFEAGSPDPDKSVVDVSSSAFLPSGHLPADGVATYTVEIALRDAHSNPVKVAGNEVAVDFRLLDFDGSEVDSVAPFTRLLATDGDGVASTALSSAKSGIWEVAIRLDDVPLAASPKRLVFEALAGSAADSTLTVSPAQAAADGVAQVTAKVVVRDANGNPAEPGELVEFAVETGSEAAPGPWLEPADGKVLTCDYWSGSGPDWCDQPGAAVVTIASEEAGEFEVSALVGGEPVGGSPAVVTFEGSEPPIDPSDWIYSVFPPPSNPEWVVLADGKSEFTLTLVASDEDGNPIPGVPVRLTGLDAAVSVSPAVAGVTGELGTPQAGRHVWALTSRTEGAFFGWIEAQVDGEWVTVGQGQFYLVFVTPPPTAGLFEVLDSPATPDGVDSALLRVTVTDLDDNPVAGHPVRFSLFDWNPQGPRFHDAVNGPLETDPILTDAHGVAETRIYSVYVGEWQVWALSLDWGIFKTVEFSYSPPPPGPVVRFSVEADSSNVDYPKARADGADGYVVTATARDRNGDPVDGGVVEVFLTPRQIPGAVVVHETVVTGQGPGGSPGVARARFAAVKSGWWDVTAKVGDEPVEVVGGIGLTSVGVEF
ncbi:MAG: Ig-like domain-containing protein, partial [Bifidobacteriaceae bacterium]|nr:Ig-like domain-containing protein [Bifidobacteriaceae bacterium]